VDTRVIDASFSTAPRGIVARALGMKNRLASFADQGMQGVANIAFNALLARSLQKSQFASVGLAFGIYFFLLGIHRAQVVLPFILDGGLPEPERSRKAEAWWWFNALFIGVMVLLLVAVAAVLRLAMPDPAQAWVVDAVHYSALVTAALCMAEFGRRWLYQHGKPIVAACASLAYLVTGAIVAVMVLLIQGGLGMGIATWVLGTTTFMTVVIIAAPPRFVSLAEIGGVWWSHRNFAFWQTLTHLPYAIYNNSVVLLIGAFGGPVAAATFTAARTLNSPVLSVVSAVDLLDKPRAARALVSDGLRGLKSSIVRTRRLLVFLNGIYLALLLLFTGPILKLAFGERYAGHEMEVRALAVAFFLICLNQPSETMLIVLRASRTMFLTRLCAAVSAVVAIFTLSRAFGPLGCTGAIVLVQVINLACLSFGERYAARKWAG